MYVRYRHDNLSIGVGNSADAAIDNSVDIELTQPFEKESWCTWEDVEPYVRTVLANETQ
jgi:hypothetical protein